MNKAFLIGNLTRDPELRTTNTGISVCTFTIAVNRRFPNSQGVKEADFISIVTWRQLAELCSRFLQKGKKVSVVGSIQTRTYDAQDGTKRYVTEIVADDVEFLSPAGEGARMPRQNEEIPLPPDPGVNMSSAASDNTMHEAEDDDLPF